QEPKVTKHQLMKIARRFFAEKKFKKAIESYEALIRDGGDILDAQIYLELALCYLHETQDSKNPKVNFYLLLSAWICRVDFEDFISNIKHAWTKTFIFILLGENKKSEETFAVFLEMIEEFRM